MDALRRLTRLLRELAHLLGDNGESASLLAGTRRLNRRIQSEQIRLPRNVRDEIDDLDCVSVALLQELRLLDRLLPCTCEFRRTLCHLFNRLVDRLRRGRDLLNRFEQPLVVNLRIFCHVLLPP